jgi:uncharacterized protein (TIGR03067 family)
MKMTLKKSLGSTALSLLLPCLLLGLQAGCTTNQPTPSELQRLQGTWEGVMVGKEKDGKITIKITGNSLHFHRDSNFWFETTITLPAGTDPKQLHATIKHSAAPEDSNGKVVLAIFKIEDGTLTLAGVRTPDSEDGLPKSFENIKETMSGRFELRKVQGQKKNTELPKSK